jgi:hypothetical protein
MGRTTDKIIVWTVIGLLATGVIGYYYLAYCAGDYLYGDVA